MDKILRCGAAVIASAIASMSYAATIRIPADQPTIQAGIAVVVDGDTVLVAPGIYVENLDFSGKRIIVLGEKGPDSTKIQALNPNNPTVRLASGEPRGTVLEGFTVTGSNNSGILAFGSSPEIRRNVIAGNASSSSDQGAGVNLVNTVGAVVEENVFHHNVAATYGRSIHILGGQDDTVAFNVMHDNSGYQEIRCFTSRTVLLNNTIIGPGLGWGIQSLINAHVTAINNILAGQFGAQYSCFAGNGSTLTIAYGCIWDYAISFYGDGIVLGAGNIEADPLFVDGPSHDFGLTMLSPCINAGDPASMLDPDGTRSDIGAFYFQSSFGNLALDALDSSHVVNHAPTFLWDVFPDTGTQEAYEVEVGVDPDWAVAEMWASGEVVSAARFAVYDGLTLVDNATYLARMRGRMGGNWSGWSQTAFHMNSLPLTPTQLSPMNFGETPTNAPTLTSVVGSDAESDSQQLQFAVFMDDSLLVEESPLVPPTPVPEGDTVIWTTTQPLTENFSYIWTVRAFDGFEYTSYWSSWRVFFVNAVPEPPSPPVLLSPTSDVMVYALYPEFTWARASDPDPLDSVTYDYEISLNNIFSPALKVPGLSDTVLTLFTPLETGTRYWWRVLSRDRQAHETTSLAKQFRVYEPGDLNASWTVTSADIIALIGYVFKSQSLSVPVCGRMMDGDSDVDVADIITLVNFVFKGGAALQARCQVPNH